MELSSLNASQHTTNSVQPGQPISRDLRSRTMCKGTGNSRRRNYTRNAANVTRACLVALASMAATASGSPCTSSVIVTRCSLAERGEGGCCFVPRLLFDPILATASTTPAPSRLYSSLQGGSGKHFLRNKNWQRRNRALQRRLNSKKNIVAAAGLRNTPSSSSIAPYRQHAVPPATSVLRYRDGQDSDGDVVNDVHSEGEEEDKESRKRRKKEEKKMRKMRKMEKKEEGRRRKRTKARVWLIRKLRRKRARDKEKFVDEDDDFDDEMQRRRLEWAARYTDVSTLRETFGTNKNKLWGDFDAQTSRRLYHTLLPRALVGLYERGVMEPQELAPLAYEARIAAKMYSRERCVVPARMLATAYDGFRTLKNQGRWSMHGLSWEELWAKYEKQVIDEIDDWSDDDDDDLTTQICLRILEQSCKTNLFVDRLVTADTAKRGALQRRMDIDIATIKSKLDQDIQELLLKPNGTPSPVKRNKARRKMEAVEDTGEDTDPPTFTQKNSEKMTPVEDVLLRIFGAFRDTLDLLRLQDKSDDNKSLTHFEQYLRSVSMKQSITSCFREEEGD